ncbi:MFS transporter [Stenotrophomonas sp. SORGH_AS_0282]|jgi:MFS family permease|uniref:MFS transporter n=1 Tax=Stenotrophomonas sp. SORGH_AS_0282 TaxID=3041763 RepID=UPI002782FB18|nr:MFS transporter [Stenotrophomonas sp. SORGH_AS_0282]MDQ1062493.1 DHA1 family tetracycline resistance protein-like MFS transporter [Stenotrophomonas sp. SORGH_AS_0282]MDQ1189153.1 DHA1 family tetracycline resistance protein-like MFS transporter [Stenotrophomonas sp. SORGH_AS_0282]
MRSTPVVSGLPALVFAAWVGTMAMMAFVAVIGPVVRLLGLSEWHAGLSVTAAGVLWMLSAPRWGALSDRIGRRRVLLIALAAYAVVYIVMAVFVDTALQAPPAVWLSVLVLVGTRALVGLFYAAVPPTAAALVADEAAPGQRAGAMAKLGSANALGMVIGPAAAGWVAFHDLALTLYVAALLPVLALLVIAWRLPSAPPPAAPTNGPRAALAWYDPRLRLPVMAVFAAMISVTIAQVTVGFFAIDRLQLAPAAGARMAGLALTAVGVGLIVAQVLVMTFKTMPPRRWIALGAVISGIGFAAVALVQAPWQLLATYALAAFGMGFVFPSFQALAADSVQAHEQGAAAGAVASVQGLGMVIGPMVGTLLYRAAPSAPYLLVGLVLLGLAVAATLDGRRAA